MNREKITELEEEIMELSKEPQFYGNIVKMQELIKFHKQLIDKDLERNYK